MKQRFATLMGCLLTIVALGARPACADPAQDALSAARAKLDGLSSYHLRLDDETGETDIDYMRPQRVRIQGPTSTALLIGGSVYLRTGDTWIPAGVNPTLILLMATLEQDSFIAFTSADRVEDQGLEQLGDISAHRYEIQTPINGAILRRTLWVGVEDGLPHRVVRTNGNTTLTVTYSGFNEDFGIEAPPHMTPVSGH